MQCVQLALYAVSQFFAIPASALLISFPNRCAKPPVRLERNLHRYNSARCLANRILTFICLCFRGRQELLHWATELRQVFHDHNVRTGWSAEYSDDSAKGIGQESSSSPEGPHQEEEQEWLSTCTIRFYYLVYTHLRFWTSCSNLKTKLVLLVIGNKYNFNQSKPCVIKASSLNKMAQIYILDSFKKSWYS